MSAGFSRVRWMTIRDLPEVVRIEAASSFHPMSQDDITAVVRKRNGIGMVCESHQGIVGFMVYLMFLDRINLVRLAVDPSFRRRGIGRQLAAALADKLRPGKRTMIRLMARETNLDGQLFLRSCGFRASEVHRGHFRDSGEDGYEFTFYHRAAASIPRSAAV